MPPKRRRAARTTVSTTRRPGRCTATRCTAPTSRPWRFLVAIRSRRTKPECARRAESAPTAPPTRPRSSAGPEPGRRAASDHPYAGRADEDQTTILPRTATGARVAARRRRPARRRSRAGPRRSRTAAAHRCGRRRRRPRSGARLHGAQSDPAVGRTRGRAQRPGQLQRTQRAERLAVRTRSDGPADRRHAAHPADRRPRSPATAPGQVQLTQKGQSADSPSAGLLRRRSRGGPADPAAERPAGPEQYGQDFRPRVLQQSDGVRDSGGGGAGVRARGQDPRRLHHAGHLHRLRGRGHRARRPVRRADAAGGQRGDHRIPDGGARAHRSGPGHRRRRRSPKPAIGVDKVAARHGRRAEPQCRRRAGRAPPASGSPPLPRRVGGDALGFLATGGPAARRRGRDDLGGEQADQSPTATS